MPVLYGCCSGQHCKITKVKAKYTCEFSTCAYCCLYRLGRYEEAEVRLGTAVKLADDCDDGETAEDIALRLVKALEASTNCCATVQNMTVSGKYAGKHSKCQQIFRIIPSMQSRICWAADRCTLSWKGSLLPLAAGLPPAGRCLLLQQLLPNADLMASTWICAKALMAAVLQEQKLSTGLAGVAGAQPPTLHQYCKASSLA